MHAYLKKKILNNFQAKFNYNVTERLKTRALKALRRLLGLQQVHLEP